jgi:WhiB family redox-sensing transcriptional regulator
VDANEALIRCVMSSGEPDVDVYLAQLLNRPRWHAEAECRGEGTDAFITDKPSEDVLELCRRCLVREECLEFALEDESAVGVWDGTTEVERRAWRKAKQTVA